MTLTSARKAPPPRTSKSRAKLSAVPAPKLSREAVDGGRSEMAEAIHAMPANYVVCRESRHHWVPFTARPAAHGNFERVRRCDSCGGVKWTLLDSRFRILEEKPIQYPEGYLLQGLGRLTGDDLAVVRGINVMREIAMDDAANPPKPASRKKA